MEDFLQKAKAVMLGHAIGDALGVPAEFKSREVLRENPVKDMQAYGIYDLPKGAWSDDTSMALCTLASLPKGKIDYDDIMRNFGKWYYEGEFTPTERVFDVGGTCENAIHRYFNENLPYDKCGLTDDYSNGNGSLMRIHPIVLYFLHKNQSVKHFKTIKAISMASALTHAHPRSRLACNIYAFVLENLFKKPDKKSVDYAITEMLSTYRHFCYSQDVLKDEFNELQHFSRLSNLENLAEDEIKSDGYVVNTLEAALWCLLKTDSYKDCVLKAVNLGGDTDTVAAIAGGLAGALYGYDAIPKEWLNTLLKRDYIENLCAQAFKEGR